MWKPSEFSSGVPPTDANLNSISLEYSFAEVSKACRNFSPSSLLGRGSYGSVYRGVLKDGTEVAIKVLNVPKESGFKEEVLVLSKFRHPNLVILMGFSRNGKNRYLIYELLSGGDLCSRIQKDPAFDWRKRTTACLDAALGLSHLHNASPKVFHRDIKTQNILLDRNGIAKMADFGLALLVQPNAGVKVEQCSGTLGYADPLYISSSVVTERSEVYSFGMVVLETLTGRPPAVQNPVNGQVQYVYGHVGRDIAPIMAMVQWRAGWPPELAQRMARLALACIDRTESNRPVFVDLVARLRDLVNRSFSSPAPFPVSTPSPSPLVRNQMQLEEAFRKLQPAPMEPKAAKWNPFDLSDDEPLRRDVVKRGSSIEEAASPKPVRPLLLVKQLGQPDPTVEEPVLVAVVGDSGSPALPPAAQPPTAVGPPPLPTGSAGSAGSAESGAVCEQLVNKAVADFDDELRSISSKPGDIDKALSALFPSSSSTMGSPSVDDESGHIRRREIATHLLAAGFSLEQTREALKRTTSVEAAVEWIVEQRWAS